MPKTFAIIALSNQWTSYQKKINAFFNETAQCNSLFSKINGGSMKFKWQIYEIYTNRSFVSLTENLQMGKYS